jgi:hypothetical protein
MNDGVERIRKGLTKTMKSSVVIDGVPAELGKRHLPITKLCHRFANLLGPQILITKRHPKA